MQRDAEWLVSITTAASFEEVRQAISCVHSYERLGGRSGSGQLRVPMIIQELEAAADGHRYWTPGGSQVQPRRGVACCAT